MIYITFTSISAMYKQYSQIIHHSNENKNNFLKKSIKMEEDVGTSKPKKVYEQGREVNVEPKIKHITSV